MFEEMVKSPSVWLSGEGPEHSTVLSSRVRLARNIRGLNYPPNAKGESKREALEIVRAAIEKTDSLRQGEFYLADSIEELDRAFLIERHVISPEFLGDRENQALHISAGEQISIMVNEEDHLRIQSIQPGLSLESTCGQAERVDEDLGRVLEFDFDREFGYLTSCPTNVGTGMRASVLIHLPGLALTREMDNIISSITKFGLAVRGFYGEGSDVLGNLFQLSNQTTLGRSEDDIIDSLVKVTKQMIEYEDGARQTLMADAREQIEDKIWRAYGILKHARVLTSAEVMNLLSAVRLGIGMGMIEELPLSAVNSTLLLAQPAHLQKYLRKKMSSNERDEARAELVRKMFRNGSETYT
jgi:protein arginine kinase